jgi:hypothetical protein
MYEPLIISLDQAFCCSCNLGLYTLRGDWLSIYADVHSFWNHNLSLGCWNYCRVPFLYLSVLHCVMDSQCRTRNMNSVQLNINFDPVWYLSCGLIFTETTNSIHKYTPPRQALLNLGSELTNIFQNSGSVCRIVCVIKSTKCNDLCEGDKIC